MDETGIRKKIKAKWDSIACSQKSLASEMGISPQYLSEILSGDKPITDNIARKFGYRMKEREFEKIKGEK